MFRISKMFRRILNKLKISLKMKMKDRKDQSLSIQLNQIHAQLFELLLFFLIKYIGNYRRAFY